MAIAFLGFGFSPDIAQKFGMDPVQVMILYVPCCCLPFHLIITDSFYIKFIIIEQRTPLYSKAAFAVTALIFHFISGPAMNTYNRKKLLIISMGFMAIRTKHHEKEHNICIMIPH
mgnify:CR=1 FL=1